MGFAAASGGIGNDGPNPTEVIGSTAAIGLAEERKLAEAETEGARKCCHKPMAITAPKNAENVQSQTVFFMF